MKKKLAILLVLLTTLFIFGYKNVQAETKRVSLIDSLKTIDPELRKNFPRWRVCEPDLMFQIYQAFVLLGFNKDQLSMQKIEILAAPRSPSDKIFELLLVSCGDADLNSLQIDEHIRNIADVLCGKKSFATGRKSIDERDYCFVEIPPERPVTPSQADAIINYFQPTNVSQAFTLSLFEQSVKIGKTGVWLTSAIGNDPIGMPFWTSGEAKFLFNTPIYENLDYKTKDRIPFLITAQLGGGYRLTNGIDNHGSVLSWVTSRKLNGGPGGKLILGLDFHMPFYPIAGINFNMEVPLKKLQDELIDPVSYSKYAPSPVQIYNGTDGGILDSVAPILRTTGQVTAFYNWWLDENNPENYFRFDVGLNYSEVQEFGMIKYSDGNSNIYHLKTDLTDSLITYKPNEFADWLFLKVEYRNQAAFPFGASLQISNQTFLGRAYMRIFGNWFFLEGRYAYVLRDVRPYENKSFFMFSPVIRITI